MPVLEVGAPLPEILDSQLNYRTQYCHQLDSVSLKKLQAPWVNGSFSVYLSFSSITEPYDYPSWCLILVFSVHASGAAIFIFEWLSPSGLDRGDKPLRGKTETKQNKWKIHVHSREVAPVGNGCRIAKCSN